MTEHRPRNTGLCGSCRFHAVIRSRRGSEFHRCGRSEEDAAYPKYPRLPVVQCAGYESNGGKAAIPSPEH